MTLTARLVPIYNGPALNWLRRLILAGAFEDYRPKVVE